MWGSWRDISLYMETLHSLGSFQLFLFSERKRFLIYLLVCHQLILDSVWVYSEKNYLMSAPFGVGCCFNGVTRTQRFSQMLFGWNNFNFVVKMLFLWFWFVYIVNALFFCPYQFFYHSASTFGFLIRMFLVFKQTIINNSNDFWELDCGDYCPKYMNVKLLLDFIGPIRLSKTLELIDGGFYSSKCFEGWTDNYCFQFVYVSVWW